MRRPLPASPVVLAAVLAASSVFAACADPAEPAVTAAPPAPTPSPTPTMSAEEQCLTSGTWVIDAEHEEVAEVQGMSAHTSQMEATITGEATYVFADGELTRTFTGWHQVTRMVLTVQPGVVVDTTSTTDGSAVSPYKATPTRIDVARGDATGITFSEEVLENGTPWTSPSDRQESEREMLEFPDSWHYTCDDSTLQLTRLRDGQAPDPVEASDTTLLHHR